MIITRKISFFIICILCANSSIYPSDLIAPPGLSQYSGPKKNEVLHLEDYQTLSSRKTDGLFVNFDPGFNYNDVFSKKGINPKGKSVLVLGCGPGAICFRLLLEGASNVVGVDLDEHSIILARFLSLYINNPILLDGIRKEEPKIDNVFELIKLLNNKETKEQIICIDNPNIKFIVGDASKKYIDGNNMFDIVLVPFLLGTFIGGITDGNQMINTMNEILRVCKLNGHVIIHPFSLYAKFNPQSSLFKLSNVIREFVTKRKLQETINDEVFRIVTDVKTLEPDNKDVVTSK